MLRKVAIAIAALICVAAPAWAGPVAQTLAVTLENHRFSPDVITIPADTRVKIDFTNRDATADDFESADLHVDKEIGPHGRTAFFIGPLKPGTYPFKAELHVDTAHGKVVVE